MHSLKMSALLIAALAFAIPAMGATDPDAMARALEQVNQRLDTLEQQNRQLVQRVDELTQQNETLSAANQSPPVAPEPAAVKPAAAPAAPREEWESRIRLGGDFRFRHESIDNSALSDERTRESIRARVSANIKVNDTLKAEIGIGSGGRDPRGGAATLGDASSRKDIGLDLAYMSWRPIEELSLTAGKMREPYVRPGRSQFFDNEIRPEGIAVNYKDKHGLFGTAFRFWLEERALDADSTLSGGQIGWDGTLGAASLKVGGGFWNFDNIKGRFPGFGNSIVSELGNSITGTSAAARYVYDYHIGQLFAETTFPIAGVPLNFFADYGHNYAADNGLDTAYSVGVLVGKASAPGKWEVGVMNQKVEKDALFAHWTDSDYGSGVTDNDGFAWRLAVMAMKSLTIDLTYYDTRYNVDVGNEADYDRWQINFISTF
ncbi:MAG TPA: putative porin [Povalibacter sp.]|jgi:hypothetical protein